VILKIVPGFGRECTLKKIDQREQRKARTEKFIQLSEQFLEIVSVFKEAGRNVIFIFLLNKEQGRIF
jgi:hypothetical protein